MTAGKTTVASKLGARLGWTVTDLDSHIESQAQQTISQIFETHGEEHFRTTEKCALRNCFHIVIATGGGTFISVANREFINDDGISVWLDVSLKTVTQRLGSNRKRPLATDRDSMALLYETRRKAYEPAHLRLKADRATPDELASLIVAHLAQL